MKKLVATAVAAVAMLAFASPAFAQAVIVDDDDLFFDDDLSLVFLNASQVQSGDITQINTVDANAAATDGSFAAAASGNVLFVHQTQVVNGGF